MSSSNRAGLSLTETLIASALLLLVSAVVFSMLVPMLGRSVKLDEKEENLQRIVVLRHHLGLRLRPSHILRVLPDRVEFQAPARVATPHGNLIQIGPDGKMSSLRQLLHPDNFARVKPGASRDDVRKLLAQLGRRLDDFDLLEVNEAFAAQVLACDRDLGFDPERLNVNGGAIALGHPIGATGARIVVTLLHELQRRGARLGLAALCVSGGMGLAAAFERLD